MRSTERLVVDAIAVYRLTKLATDDSITQPIRDRIIEAAYATQGRVEHERRAFEEHEGAMREGDWQRIVEEDDEPPKLAALVTCRWCASMWVALGLVAVVRRARWWPAMSDALAFSAAGALLARFEE